MWHVGQQEILPKAKSKILELAIPKTKREVQEFIGLFRFWRCHIPHLSAILRPLFSVTQKKYEFSWGPEQAAAFEAAKMAVQTTSDLWPVKEGIAGLF